jgi:glycosyltransferase involved in cell wall biosynthesis
MHPLVSVIVPNYNHASYLGMTLDAILAQTCEDFELLVVDDASSDDSPEVIEEYQKRDSRIIPVLFRTNSGVSYCRNRAIEKSRGEYIAFCDADDIWNKDKLKAQIDRLETLREYDVAFSDAMIIDEHGKKTGQTFSAKYGKPKDIEGNLFWQLCETNFINNSSVILRKRCVDTVGLLDERLRYLQDWLYWICLARHFRFLSLDSILVEYRVHPRSSNRDTTGYSREWTLMGKTVIDRFFDLPPRVKADLYYRLGNEHAFLSEKKAAYESYLMSLRCNGIHVKSYVRLVELVLGLRTASA